MHADLHDVVTDLLVKAEQFDKNNMGRLRLKYYALIIMLCALPLKCSIIPSPTADAGQQYYISHSPYYTRGYLAAQPEYSHLMHGPSPYWYSKSVSRPVSVFLRRKYI